MELKYLWDTNTAIYYLQKIFPAAAEEFIDKLILSNIPVLSIISEIELLCWRSATKNDLQILKNFIAECKVFSLDEAVKLKTIEIRRTHKIKLPDAIIGATALEYNLTIITRNISDFDDVIGLNVVNPFEQ